MHRFTRMACLALVIGGLAEALCPAPVSAQVVQVYYPPAAPVVSYYAAPAPVAPVTYSYYPPVYTAPVYAAPAYTTYYAAPTTVFSAPVAAPVYAAPTTAYYPPSVVNTGVVTTRSYYGLGVFRPRGWTSTSAYTPTGTIVTAPRVSYYGAPVYVP